jgi:hypothetical protein
MARPSLRARRTDASPASLSSIAVTSAAQSSSASAGTGFFASCACAKASENTSTARGPSGLAASSAIRRVQNSVASVHCASVSFSRSRIRARGVSPSARSAETRAKARRSTP